MRGRSLRPFIVMAALVLAGCVHVRTGSALDGFEPLPPFNERIRVLHPAPGVTATVVAPARLEASKPVELILYALPNGNSTAETMGRALGPGVGWRYDIQHIAAQTRALRARGLTQAVVAYLEADTKSWPEWRRVRGYEQANRAIVAIVDSVRSAIGANQLAVTLTGHSGGGSFAWGFIDGQDALPDWLVRMAFLDSNYSFEARHGDRIAEWLRRDARNTLVVLAYDDREIVLDGKKVVSDSGGTWRASHRMIEALGRQFPLVRDTLGDFIRFRGDQIEVLVHPNPANRILHTEMIGEMNGYMHALLARRPEYEAGASVLKPLRAYSPFIAADTARVP